MFEILIFARPDNQPRMKRASGHGPAIIRGAVLPAADKMDDFQTVTIYQDHVFQGGARDYLQITFHRDLCRIKANIADQIGHGGMATKTAQITIERQGDSIGGQGRSHFISQFLFTCI